MTRANTDEDIAQVLEKAADLLFRDGWCQGATLDDMGNRCLMGALIEASKSGNEMVSILEYQLPTDAAGALTRHLMDGNGDMCNIVNWNDQPGRTGVEVREELLRCAKGLRDEE